MQHKRIKARLCALAFSALLMAGCAAQADASSSAPDAGTAARNVSGAAQVSDEDLDATWDDSATKIVLEGTSASVDGDGAAADGSTVTITAAGTYVVSGTLDDGQIYIEAPEGALVRLVLNGAQIHNTISAPLYCEQADKLVVILAEGTQNILSDGENYVFPDKASDEPNATLFCRADLTINGTGALTIKAAYNNGIGTKDDLILVSGIYDITAANHAIRGRDSVTVLDGRYSLVAGNDGIQANNDAGEDKGWIELYDGTFNITSAHDGIQAETTLAIYDGEYTITAGGGSANAATHTGNDMGPGMPGGGQMPDGMGDGQMPGTPGQRPDGTPPAAPPDQTGTAPASQPAQAAAAAESEADETTGDTTADSDTANASTSYKGIKSGTALSVSGGTFIIDSADDALHANAGVTVSGGAFTISTGDDGMHADETLLIQGEPTINILTSYEGLEGSDVTIRGGDISIVASDDGINAAGGTDGGGSGGMFGTDQFTGGGDHTITIEGGTININSGTDGVDSNGDINMSGGALYISGPTVQTEGALDFDGTFILSGGIIVAAGSTGMVQTPDDSSSQNSLLLYYSAVQRGGTTIELQDAGGNVLASYAPETEFSAVLISAPDMQQGETYTVYTDGEKTLEATLSSAVTALQDTGESAGADMGGGRPR